MNWVIIISDEGMLSVRRQAIIGTNDDLLSIGPLGIEFSDFFFIGTQTITFNKMYLKMSSENCQPFGLALNVLTNL